MDLTNATFRRCCSAFFSAGVLVDGDFVGEPGGVVRLFDLPLKTRRSMLLYQADNRMLVRIVADISVINYMSSFSSTDEQLY
jgi:hypothetical protein